MTGEGGLGVVQDILNGKLKIDAVRLEETVHVKPRFNPQQTASLICRELSRTNAFDRERRAGEGRVIPT
jgi:hypothetical protein